MPGGGALFGSSATGPGSTGGNKHLVEMRAGKMNLKGHMVYPDKRKGLLYVYQSDDSLMHFCWQDRTSGNVEDDLIIFPDDCEYIKVPQCTTGRVYLLKFKSSNRKFFFWLQEPRNDKDEENCKRINELLNNPSTAVQSGHRHDQDLQSLLNNMSQSQLMQLFGGGVGQMGALTNLLGTIRSSNTGSARTSTTPAITHRPTASTISSSLPAVISSNSSLTTTTTSSPKTPQNTAKPMSATPIIPPNTSSVVTATATPIIATTTTTGATSSSPNSGSGAGAGAAVTGTAAAAATATSTATGTSSATSASNGAQKIQLSDFQSFLQTFMQTHPNSTSATSSATNIAPIIPRQNVDLSTAISGETLSDILNNPDALQLLQNHLPNIEGNPQEALKSTLASPQFQQALKQFSSALQSGQIGPVVSQLSVNPEAVAAASQGNMKEFVKALEKAKSSSKENNNNNKDNKNNKNNKKDNKKNDKDDDELMQLD